MDGIRALKEFKRQNHQFLRYVGGDDVVFNSSIQDYKTYVLFIIRRYDKRSQVFKTIHHLLQLIILIGAALVAILIGIPAIPKLIPAILSGVVAAASAIANYYKFGERGRDLRFYAEDMALEYNRFDTKRGLYKGLDVEQAHSLFMDRIEGLFYGQRQRVLALERTQTEQK